MIYTEDQNISGKTFFVVNILSLQLKMQGCIDTFHGEYMN